MNNKQFSTKTISGLMATTFLLMLLILSACIGEEEAPEPVQKVNQSNAQLEDQAYSLEIYDCQDNLLLRREGKAFHVVGEQGSRLGIRLDDPLFGKGTAMDTFSTLYLSIPMISQPARIDIDGASAHASIQEQWYSLPGDWGYTGASGEINIDLASDNHLGGNFIIRMKTREGATAHAQWGDKIVVKGRFLSYIHP